MTNHNHPYHLVENSPWPISASLSAMLLTTGLVKWFYHLSLSLFILGLISVTSASSQWWRDISRESSMKGLHTLKVTAGLRLGMLFFIVSEILFFFAFFWAFFHSSLTPIMQIGAVWPPLAIQPFSPFQIPLLNTAILLSSGVTVTWAHHSMTENLYTQSVQGLILTIIMGVYFTILQAMEYLESPFTLADSVYGTTFFVSTGFHGLHVIIGTTFLLTCLIRLLTAHFSSYHHTGLEMAIWYWHFVDVVWLFLFTTIYWWGS